MSIIQSDRLGIGYEEIRLRNPILQEVDLLGNEIFRTASETDDHNAVICTVFSFSMIRIQQQRRETWWSTKSEKHKDESEIFGDFNERILVGIIISMSCTIITV